ncbi:unnamed protein product [Symbiodinium necroappetens]|uniref:Uncharacterized protein n=1 Tax=Symbiodinium necroappetens TaxID=1628268 RepID=A0A813BRB0_9DINO|nr:unnamed protein product [Symbiodinium necroappetens]
MQQSYKDLVTKQAESITGTCDKPLTSHEPFNDALLKLFATITKQDVMMNNYVVRSKSYAKKGAASTKATPKRAAAAKPAKEKKEKKDKKPKKEKKATGPKTKKGADGAE